MKSLRPVLRGLESTRHPLERLQRAVSGTSFPYLKHLVGIALGLSEKAKDAKINTAACQGLISRAVDAVVSVADVISEPEGDLPAELMQNLHELQEALQEILSFVLELIADDSTSSGLARLIWVDHIAGRIQRYDNRLTYALSKFRLKSGVQMQLTLGNMRGAVNTVQETVNSIEQKLVRNADQMEGYAARQDALVRVQMDREISALLQTFLPYVAASWDPHQACLTGTRTRILRQITSWQRNVRNSSNVFFLRGMAGCGKTAIAHSVAEQSSRDELVSSFFFKTDTAGRNTPQFVFSTLAHDLASQVPLLRSAIFKALQDDINLQHKALQIQFDELILKPVMTALAGSCTSCPFLVVWDGLDECGDVTTRKSIFRILQTGLLRLSPFLSFFITSRPITDVDQLMCDLHAMQLDLTPVTDDTRQDLMLYIDHRLQKIALQHDRAHDWVQSSDVMTLTQHASGLFIWASIALTFVESGMNPEHQLDCLLAGAPAQKTELALDKLFTLAIFGIDIDDFAKPFQQVVGAVLALQRPLHIAALSELINCPISRTASVVRQLGAVLTPLATGPGGNHVIQLLHPSIFDFLTSNTRCNNLAFYIDIKFQHTCLAIRCLSLMHLALRKDICRIRNPNVLNAQIADLSIRLQQHVPEALQYSCLFMAAHVLSTPETDGLLPFLTDFYFNDILFWLEVMSLMKQIPLAITALSMFYKLLNSQPVGRNLCLIAYDTLRFTNQYAYIISTKASNVYSCALSFVPRSPSLYHVLYPSEVLNTVDSIWIPLRKVLERHNDNVTSVALSNDGNCIASGSWDNKICLWNGHTGKLLLPPLVGHSSTVTTIAFCNNRKYCDLASGSWDGTIRLWDATTGASLLTPLLGHTQEVISVAFSSDGEYIVSGSWDNTICLWYAETGQLVIDPLEGHTEAVGAVAFSTEGDKIVSGSWDRTVRIWESETGEMLLPPMQGHTGNVGSVAFSPADAYIVSGSWDQTVRVWDAVTGFPLQVFRGHTDSVSSVAFSQDAKSILSGSWDCTVYMWDVALGSRLLGPLQGHTGRVTSVAFSSCGSHIISAALDKTKALWDAKTGHIISPSLDSESMMVDIVRCQSATNKEQGRTHEWPLVKVVAVIDRGQVAPEPDL